MSSSTELIIDFEELSQLSIPCPKCLTRVVLDLNDPEARIPEACPSCAEEYDGGFRTSLHTFRQIYRKLSDPGARKVQIRIAAK